MMKGMRVRPLLFASAISVIISSLGICAYSQDSRPRYSTGRPAADWVVPEETVISMRMDTDLSSRTARVGDRFSSTVTIPVYVGGKPVIPAGTLVEGRVTQVTPAKRGSKSGTIAVEFDEMVFPNGSRSRLSGSLTADDPAMREKIDEESTVSGNTDNRAAVFVGGGGVVGAVLGGIAGGGKGAVLGGVIGAGAGVAGVLLSKGEEAEVPSGTRFGIKLRQPLVVRESSLSENRPRPGAGADYEPRRPAAREPSGLGDRGSARSLPLTSPEMIRRAQAALKAQGYYEGQIDGILGSRTTTALRTYQRENRLPETGNLDAETARSLGITGGAPVSDRVGGDPPPMRVVLADIVSATANRNSSGAIDVLIETRANTGGWRWFGDHVTNGDTLEVYARAESPSGMATQALTRGRIQMTVADGVEHVRQVVVHGAGGDVTIPLGRMVDPDAALSLQRRGDELLADYQRSAGIRLTSTGIQMDGQRGQGSSEVELLFAIDAFVSAAQLYAMLAPSLSDQESLRTATLSLARQARRTDIAISSSQSQFVGGITAPWDAIRQEVLSLMGAHGITSEELDR